MNFLQIIGYEFLKFQVPKFLNAKINSMNLLQIIGYKFPSVIQIPKF